MKTMFDVKKLGVSNKMKVLVFFMLCAIWAMAWTFVKVGHQVEIDQSRLADVGEQLVLSQRIAKYALSSTAGDMEAFSRLETSKNKFSSMLDAQMTDYGDGTGVSETPENLALINMDNRWSGFRYSIDEVLEGQFLIMAMAEEGERATAITPRRIASTSRCVTEKLFVALK